MEQSNNRNPQYPEVWAGLECTVNRVGDEYMDQMQLNGHAYREEDIALFGAIGVKKMRYPLLWELTAPNGPATADWSWGDRRLKLLQEHNITPILGLVHHGSGPQHTNLADPAFPEGVAEYARAVAERYPWVEYFTPVNEPWTTARFSGLYGVWYPHGRDGYTFGLTLLHQCKATVLAMRAIREIIPHAKLVQTEDLGKTYSTPLLAYQAAADNDRRWVSLDLLTGKLTPEHTMWKYFVAHGIPEADLQWFRDNPCPPDIIGINHYPTSERYLDEKLEGYPEWSHGGNGIHQYADVEALRVKTEDPAGFYSGHKVLLQETWERYGLPISVTEVHICGAREEQVQWFKHVWDSCTELKRNGVNIVGVAAWSLLGTFDWVNLVTRADGFYEPGVFDVRGPSPRPTALAKMLTKLATGQNYEHALFHLPGWWQRPDRFFYPFTDESRQEHSEIFLRREESRFGRGTKAYWRLNWNPIFETETIPDGDGLTEQEVHHLENTTQPILITGATGTLGSAFARICSDRHIPYRLLGRKQMNITDPFSIERAINYYNPWAVINAAGYVKVDDAEDDPENCHLVNTHGALLLAAACQKRGVQYLTFSSDLVFDGLKQQPYTESDPVNPINVYGQSKANAEKFVLDMYPQALIVRTSSFFGPWDDSNFLTMMLNQLSKGNTFLAPEDIIVSPTYVPDLVNACLDLLVDEESGIWHLSNEGEISWADLARRGAEIAGLSPQLVQGFVANELQGLQAKRPRYSALISERGQLLPALEDALIRYVNRIKISKRIALSI
ncbi:family 1 glycosylhydrolase [Adhaeribacter aquaticus]|uniref:family 1 glycosylhydrolase n=1 Tax=Adhaeribacter aquaticus TaxID=299567 RepID=UPI00041B3698|nr:family 1 glycosylhydrolase [Adhaeribacter aquaticus]